VLGFGWAFSAFVFFPPGPSCHVCLNAVQLLFQLIFENTNLFKFFFSGIGSFLFSFRISTLRPVLTFFWFFQDIRPFFYADHVPTKGFPKLHLPWTGTQVCVPPAIRDDPSRFRLHPVRLTTHSPLCPSPPVPGPFMTPPPFPLGFSRELRICPYMWYPSPPVFKFSPRTHPPPPHVSLTPPRFFFPFASQWAVFTSVNPCPHPVPSNTNGVEPCSPQTPV